MPSRTGRPPISDEVARLIQHGRDREAAELGAHAQTRLRREFVDPRQQIDVIVPTLIELVGGLDESQLEAPTPCTKFSVRKVVEHMVSGATKFGAAFRGSSPGTTSEERDAVAAFPRVMQDLREAIHSEGALDRTIAAPFGDVPGEVFARFVALDGLVHGWDIATATSQPYDPPTELVDDVHAFARQALTADLRDGDTFALPTEPPAGASPLVQLVAFTGRVV